MSDAADVCLIIEGGYPYVLGGVSSWTDALIRSLPQRRFQVVALSISAQQRVPKYAIPENVVGLTDVLLDHSRPGRWFIRSNDRAIEAITTRLRSVLTDDNGAEFVALIHALESSGLGHRLLLDSRRAWKALERTYKSLLPTAPLVDFFWTWRFLARSVLAIAAAPIPDARVYHAVSTGYAGLLGARAKCVTRRPLIVTEHGIYTNERRIEICAADWIYESTASGFDVFDRTPELRDLWQEAFTSFSRIAYNMADSITTQFRANQSFQMKDGAPLSKLVIICNGIDVAQFARISPADEPRRPCILLIGRVVPIKDIRTFILATGILRQLVPDVEAIIIGPEDEDPGYAAECRSLVQQQGLQDVVRFLGRVKDIKDYFGRVDLIVLTSISEAQPFAILEAGAAGLPAVTTDVGSCREILEGDPDDVVRESGGIVVPSCDPQATAAAIAKILLNPALRRRMGEVMRKRVQAHYDETRTSRIYDELYASLSEIGTCETATRY